MKSSPWQWFKTFPGLLAAPRPDPPRQAERIVSVQRRFVLPVRAGVLAVALYFVFSSDWFNGEPTTETVVLQTLRGFFMVYIACNAIAAAIFFYWKRFAPEFFQWLAFVLGLLDGLFAAGLLLITDGMGSMAYWVFPILIVLNAISIPLAMPQIVLNLLLSMFFLGAGILYPEIAQPQNGLLYVPGHGPHAPAGTNAVAGPGHPESPERSHHPIYWNSALPLPESEEQTSTELFLLRIFMLWLLTFCCYGVQALAERQRRELEEAHEFAVRESQLHSAGRLAAEFAHQIKNPLAVITNATYSLERSLRENKNSAAQQIEIIQEEVARADRVVTQIMGYAQLSEGRVEKLDVLEELESAIAQVFPPAVTTGIRVHRQYANHFPPLLMQRGHLLEIFVNLLANARDVVSLKGNIYIKAACQSDYTIEVSIRDDGPGIPPDKITRIFEAYYTTKTKGTGMGLAIVRHNTDLYGGHVVVKSEVGKGAEFTLTFPAKAIVTLHQ
jgi:signal transduction histidine kinase